MSMVSRFRGAAALGLIAFLFLTASGCGGRDDLGNVSGKVTLDGQPIENAVLRFVPRGEGSVAVGRTDADGEYYLMFSLEVKGASLGENVVRISTHDIDVDENGNEVSIPERIPAKYNDDSELVVTVEPGNNRHDFELETGGDEIVQPGLDPGS